MRSVYIPRKDLKPGKWFYLRAPKLFMEKIYPKLTHKLGDFAEIKRGFTTGANDFFYMKDVSHLYEADYLVNPKKFQEWGVTAKNEKELKDQGLIYIENEGGERFVIEQSATLSVVRTIREYCCPHLPKEFKTLCLYVNGKGNVNSFVSKYISFYEHKSITINRGSSRRTIIGYNNIQSVRNRSPWFSLHSTRPARIFLPVLFSTRFLSFYSDKPALADQLLEYAYPKNMNESDEYLLSLYLNSTIHFMMLELWSPRMGGGSLHPNANVYSTLPMLDFNIVKDHLKRVKFGDRPTKSYKDELGQKDREGLDLALLRGMGFKDEETQSILGDIYKELVNLIEDRLIKADGSLEKLESEQESEEDEE
jgi:hypothetical protein